MFALIIAFVLLTLTACSNSSTSPSSNATPSSQSEPTPLPSSSTSSSEASISSSSQSEVSQEETSAESDTSATPDYQGLTQEQWNELQDQKENGRKSELDCPNFVHLWWEHSIDVAMIDHVGANAFEAWLKASDSIPIPDRNIYSFSKYFSITLDELVSLIETNGLTHIYDIETVKRRYEYFNGNL